MTGNNDQRGNSLTYADAGVDIAAGNALVEGIKAEAQSTGRPGADPDLGGFGGLFDLKAAGYDDPLLVAATDGVGTKLKIAIETGILDTVGIDLVAMCVNDLVVQGAEPLFFLDYLATGVLEPDAAARIVEGIAEGCRQAGCALLGGETAEMPGMYAGSDFDLAGFSVGAVNRDALLPRQGMKPGDAVIGIASDGVHSNGFSLVRKVAEVAGLDWNDPAPFESARSLGECLLTPTRIYVRQLLKTQEATRAIAGLAHITGGGLTENIPRVLPDGMGAEIELSSIAPSPVFGWLAAAGGIEGAEMLRTFNCGIGMAVICAESDADAVVAGLKKQGETASRIGVLTPSPGVSYAGWLRT